MKVLVIDTLNLVGCLVVLREVSEILLFLSLTPAEIVNLVSFRDAIWCTVLRNRIFSDSQFQERKRKINLELFQNLFDTSAFHKNRKDQKDCICFIECSYCHLMCGLNFLISVDWMLKNFGAFWVLGSCERSRRTKNRTKKLFIFINCGFMSLSD